jgi:hypothetical protein
MASGRSQIARLGDTDFRGDVGKNVTRYARDLQSVARALAAQFDADAADAQTAIRKLGKRHPALKGVNVRLRARWVVRRLRRARNLALDLSAEAVKFQGQYRKEFVDIEPPRGGGGGRGRRKSGEVDL